MPNRAIHLPALAVLFLLIVFGLIMRGAASGSAAERAPLAGAVYHERYGLTADGRLYRAGTILSAEAGDPEALLDRLYPGSWPADRPGEAKAAFTAFARWADNDIPAVLHYNLAGAPEGIDLLRAMHSAAATWNAALGQGFRFFNAGPTEARPQSCADDDPDSDGINTVAWGELDGNVLGATCTIFRPEPGNGKPRVIEFDVTMSPAVPWSTADKTPRDQFDLVSVVLHEFGHALGMNHTDAEDAVMRPSLGRGTQHRTLSEDDLAGLLALYGTGTPPPQVGPRPNIRVIGAIAKDR